MSFSLSGATITQSGTDASLSGLATVSGVTITDQADYTVYNIGDRQLNITGDLTIDPEIELLIIGYDGSGDLMTCTGSLTIGLAIQQGGFTRYSEGLAIYLEKTPGGFTNRVTFKQNANLTWNGGIISLYAGKFGFYGDNVTVRINSINSKLIYRTRERQNQLRQETDDFISTAFDFIGGDLTIVGTGQQLNGYRTTHCTGALAFSGATPNVDVFLRDYAGGGRGNELDVKMWSGARPVLINSDSGTDLQVGPHIPGNNGSYGLVRVKQEFDLNVVEFGAGAIEAAKLWFEDYNNGNRRLYNQEPPHIDLQSTEIYSVVSDASGAFPRLSVFTGAVVADTSYGNANEAANTGRFSWDYRSKNNKSDDVFDMRIGSYNHSIQSLNDVSLKGAGGTSLTATMFVDSLIAEPDKTVVDAYPIVVSLSDSTLTVTGDNATLQSLTTHQLYDAAKAYLIDNYAGESQTILTRVGKAINARTLVLALDYIDFDGDLQSSSAITVAEITEGRTIKDSPDVTIETLPVNLTLDNAVLNIGLGADVTEYTELNGGSYKATADGEYIARLKDASIIDANGFTITVVTAALPTPSIMNFVADGATRWAIYDNHKSFVESGSGDKVLKHIGGLDAGVWTLVSHKKGYAGQIDRWTSDDGSVTNLTFVGSQIRRSTGEVATMDDPFPDATTSVSAGRIHTLIANKAVGPQQIINSQQSFLNTDAGLNWIRLNQPLDYPTWAAMNGITYLLTKEGFTYDSVPGNTQEAAIAATLISAASHLSIITANGGVTVSGGALTGADIATAIWAAQRTDHAAEGTMGEAQSAAADMATITAQNTQT